jgi:hypothetical protein
VQVPEARRAGVAGGTLRVYLPGTCTRGKCAYPRGAPDALRITAGVFLSECSYGNDIPVPSAPHPHGVCGLFCMPDGDNFGQDGQGNFFGGLPAQGQADGAVQAR